MNCWRTSTKQTPTPQPISERMADPRDTTAVWEATFRNAYPSVYRALVAVLLDAELAQDALQQAFEQGLRKPPPHTDALPGWLFRVAVRWARRSRRVQLPFRLDELIGSGGGPPAAPATRSLGPPASR